MGRVSLDPEFTQIKQNKTKVFNLLFKSIQKFLVLIISMFNIKIKKCKYLLLTSRKYVYSKNSKKLVVFKILRLSWVYLYSFCYFLKIKIEFYRLIFQ